MVSLQLTPASVGRSLWFRSCGDWNCSMRATVTLGIDTLIANILVFFCFGATVCKTVRPVLSDRCLSVCEVGVLWLLWPNGWTDQNATWRAGRSQPKRHCVRWGPSSVPQRGTAPDFGPMSVAAKRLYASAYHLVQR